jgi:quercetin dioxygenase-like cupin family protein
MTDSLATAIKRFESPDATRPMTHGKFEIVNIGGISVGRATYEPGWKWSLHVAPNVGAPLCSVEHVGLVLSGKCAVAFEDGKILELAPGDLFQVPPIPHDSWVIGDEQYVSLHFLGADKYAR